MCDWGKKNIFVKKLFVKPTRLSFTVLLIGCIIACQGKMCKQNFILEPAMFCHLAVCTHLAL